MTHTGWRKPTPGLGVAEQLAQAGERSSASKTEAFVAVKRVGAHIGLKAADMMLLDTLGAFSPPQDWREGTRPIVWPSNARLMEQTGFSLSALKRHIRRLAEAGLISFQDSPNGKRWGQRDARGQIVEAYGFDLSPLSARIGEFEALHETLLAERTLRNRLKRQITVMRRTLRARLDVLICEFGERPWRHHDEALTALLKDRPSSRATLSRLQTLLADLKQLKEVVDKAMSDAQAIDTLGDKPLSDSCLGADPAPKEPENGPHIQTTNELKLVSNAQTSEEVAGQNDGKQSSSKPMKLIEILSFCPEVAAWLATFGPLPRDWSELRQNLPSLPPMIGIPDLQWRDAQQRLGLEQAARALILVFEKFCAGEVSKPAGYLRGMVRKAEIGQLNIDRSFHGRKTRMAA